LKTPLPLAMARGRVAVTKDNVSPVVETLIWFCLVVCILTVLVRLTIKRYILRRFDLDDYFICISLVWGFPGGVGG